MIPTPPASSTESDAEAIAGCGDCEKHSTIFPAAIVALRLPG